MHRHTRAAFALALAGSLMATGTAAKAATPGRKALQATTAAKAAGIISAGGAYMGWAAHSVGAARPARNGPALRLNAAAGQGLAGVDVSAWNGSVDWSGLAANGARFAYVKATEGNYYTSATFAQQYDASHQAGLIRGAYHFGNPAVSTGADQASYFVAHGGGWTPDGTTLPGVLDIEYNPYGQTCYGKSTSQMVDWIASFTDQYKKLTKRDAVIYSTTDWWNQCTGDTTQFNSTNPLWLARYAATPGILPGQWPFYTFWQYTDTPIDQSWFNGTVAGLSTLASGSAPAVPPKPKPKPAPKPKPKPAPKPSPKQVPRPAHLRVLHAGMSGADVKYAQQLLNLLGTHLGTDGVDGPATTAAVKSFQRGKHLVADGIVGPVTWAHLQTAAGQQIRTPPKPKPKPKPAPKPSPKQVPRPAHLRVLHAGMSGADVKYAQQLLNLLGTHLGTDGVDGPATTAAVKSFQRGKHLVADGIVGPVTWAHLQTATGQ